MSHSILFVALASGPLPTIANEMRVAIEATLTALPLAVRESFAVAQQLVPKFKQIQSRSILGASYDHLSHRHSH